MVSIVKSNKGKPKLVLDGYTYNNEKIIDTRYYWCCERKQSGCFGRIITELIDNVHSISKQSLTHNHMVNPHRGIAIAAINRMNVEATGNDEQPTAIQKRVKRPLVEEALVQLPSSNALAQRIKRRRHEAYGKENLRSPDFELPASATVYDSETFLVGDNRNRDNRIIIFGSKVGLKLLYNAKMISMDGTFRSSPFGFMQLYTVHAAVIVNGKFQIC